jgi:hypothetical protein
MAVIEKSGGRTQDGICRLPSLIRKTALLCFCINSVVLSFVFSDLLAFLWEVLGNQQKVTNTQPVFVINQSD